MNLTQYAVHRGCSRTAVQQAVRWGRITREPDGTFDPVRCDRDWLANTQARRTPKAKRAKAGNGHAPPPAPPAPPPPAPPKARGRAPATMTYADAHAMRERYLARQARVDYLVSKGKLVDADRVRADSFETGQRVRDRMLAIADRLAPVVIGMETIADAHAAIITEVRQALDELTAR